MVFPGGTVDNTDDVCCSILMVGIEDLIHKQLEGSNSSVETKRHGLILQVPKKRWTKPFSLVRKGIKGSASKPLSGR